METGQTAKTVKVFVLGRPGTGKSTATRHMAQIARGHRWRTEHVDDYSILDWMYKNDHAGRFSPASTQFEGFHVNDPVVLDDALSFLWNRVDSALTRALGRMTLVTIEFARSTYTTSLKQFGRDFLQASYFLFLDSDIDTCMARIEHRAQHPFYEGDHFVSPETMQTFYASDDIPSTRAMLKTEYGIDAKRIRVIYNLFSEEVFLSEVYQFIERVIRQEAASYCEKR